MNPVTEIARNISGNNFARLTNKVISQADPVTLPHLFDTMVSGLKLFRNELHLRYLAFFLSLAGAILIIISFCCVIVSVK